MRHLFLIIICLLPFLVNAQKIHNNCKLAIPLCSTEEFLFASMEDNGLNPEFYSSCNEDLTYTSQVWLKWRMSENSTLDYTITPLIDNDDLDFILYKSFSESCNNLKEVRCMASGINLDRSPLIQSNCTGKTGLGNDSDIAEAVGCNPTRNNFLAPVSTIKGEEYYLLVLNSSSSNGFKLNFGDDVKFDPHYCQEGSYASPFEVLELAPNPVSNILSVIIYSDSPQQAEIMIHDQSEQSISIETRELTKGIQKVNVNTATYPAAAYLLTIKVGKKYSSKKFVKI